MKVKYTFDLGCGMHSAKKLHLELDKACRDGFLAAGLKEDRHA